MNLLAGNSQNFINGVFANWQVILFAVFAVLLLLTILFRKFKVVPIVLVCIAVLIFGVLIVDLISKAVKWKLTELVDFLVRWVPTILFAATVIIATLVGAARGLRKSLILLAHEVGAGVVCIILYAVLINVPAVDKFMLGFVNLFMGGAGSLERTLGVTAQCSGLKQVFVEWLPTVLTGDFSTLLGGSKAYIYTLADLIYHVGFAVVLLIVYILLDIIMYIIYHCCYPERKYKRKINEAFAENKVDRDYSSHTVGGSVVGLVRGCTIGILGLSVLGTALFMVAGRGEGKLKDADLGKDDYNTYYSLYRSVESYGTYGIYKVLNAVSSPDEVPYYLFAADLVFSGELEDEEFGIKEHIVFREELNAYTGFARDTMSLLLKYGAEELKPVLSGVATKEAFNTVVDVMSNEYFRAEFNDLINEFDAQTYVINLGMSFVNTAIANIDDLEFTQSVSAENRELFKLLFTKGYLSDVIPDEKLIKEALDGTEGEFSMPYINVSRLVNKHDVQIIFNVALDVLTGKIENVNDTVALVGKLLPQIKEISLLSEDRAKELNPVLGRLYCYAANRYLTEEGAAGVTYSSVYRENIDWTGEMRGLVEAAEASFKLYDYVYESGRNPYEVLEALFDEDGEHYAEICEYYDNICDSVAKSRVLGQVLSTSKMYKTISTALGGVFRDIYLPSDMQYQSTFDAEGNLISAGELFNVLGGLRIIGRNSDLISTFKNFNKDEDMKKLLDTMVELIEIEDGYGNTIVDYLVESDLLRAVASAAVINYGGDFVYVPKIAKESVGAVKVNFIKKKELTALFANVKDIADFVAPILEDKDANMSQAIADFVKKDVFDELLDTSTIFEGTVGQLLVKALDGNETVIIPAALKGEDLDGWVTETSSRGELRNLLDALEVVGIDVADAVNGSIDKDKVVDDVLALTGDSLDKALKSSVLHYTLSNFLTGDGVDFGSFRLIVPRAAQQSLTDDVLDGIIKKDEFKNVLKLVQELDLNDETSVSSVFVQVVKNKDVLENSYVLTASVAYTLVNNENVSGMLKLPSRYVQSATYESLTDLNSRNPWKAELPALVTALDEILGVSTAEEFEFDDDKLTESLSTLLKELNDESGIAAGGVTRLSVCYKSEIVRNNITERLDELLSGKIDDGLLQSAKEAEGNAAYYTKRELSSLCNALNIFGIDLNNFDSDELTENVRTKLLTLNEPEDDYGERSKLDVIYPSVIFSGMFSKELDRALLENEDEEGNVSPLVDATVLASVRAGSRYSKEELKNLINAIKAFGIDDFENLGSNSFDDICDKPIEEICQSKVMRAVITYQVEQSDGIDTNHPLAFESDVRILKTDEIVSLVGLIGEIGQDKIEDMYFDSVPFTSLKAYTFENGEVKSYLLLKCISECIKNSREIIVNVSLIDEYNCIDANEVEMLIDTVILMQGENVSIESFTEFNYPNLTSYERKIAFSSELVRAKVTEQIIEKNKELGNNYVGKPKIREFKDWSTGSTRQVISQGELEALFNVIDLLGDGTYKIPPITVEVLKAKYDENPGNVDELYKSDIIRIKICDELIKRFSVLEDSATEEEVFDLKDIELKSKLTLELATVKNALGSM